MTVAMDTKKWMGIDVSNLGLQQTKDLKRRYIKGTVRNMYGVQKLRVEADNRYWAGWEPIRGYLTTEAKKVALTFKMLEEITGASRKVSASWFREQEWELIPEGAYIKLQDAFQDQDTFSRHYDSLRQDYDIVNSVLQRMEAVICIPLRDMEKALERDLSQAVEDMAIMRWLKEVRGIGTRFSASLVSIIMDIGDWPVVSAVWSYFGMDTITVCLNCRSISLEGADRIEFLMKQAQRRWRLHQLRKEKSGVNEEDFITSAFADSEKELCSCEEPDVHEVAPKREFFHGLLITWNPFAKTTVYKIASQFVKQGGFYRIHYDRAKAFYVNRDGDRLTPGHIEQRARRVVAKLFLSHVFEMWRRSEGLPGGKIYLQHISPLQVKILS